MAGCAWQSVSGRVLNIDGTSSERRYIVRVFNDGFGQVVETGTNSFFDPLSGWEIQVSNIINDLTYFVRLESLGGTVISPDIQVTFPQDCNGNVAFVEFAQVRSN
ncbi:MAG: hypothetical protein EA396_07945 [Anaerolineaceae bacterium]|nr:MAG: hypothetical protein EA396_07945 [Anaerolineaceae bacterium]